MAVTSRSERHELADLLLELGPDAPTKCEGWTTKDLAAHLVVRENNPVASGGILVPALADRLRRAMDEVLRSHGYAGVVGQFRTGPSGLTPFRIPAVERAANTLEFFIHHEDVRRAQPGWEPRALPADFENAVWKRLRTGGKLMYRRSAAGVLLARSDTGDTVRAHSGEPVAVIEGLPTELLIYS